MRPSQWESGPFRAAEEPSSCHRRDLWHFEPAFELMNKPKIIAYLKSTCGWSMGVRAVLKKYDLPYEDRNIINDPLQRQEMIEE